MVPALAIPGRTVEVDSTQVIMAGLRPADPGSHAEALGLPAEQGEWDRRAGS